MENSEKNAQKLTANDLINLSASLLQNAGTNFDYDYRKILVNIVALNKICKCGLSDEQIKYAQTKSANFINIATKKESSTDEQLTTIKNKLRVQIRKTRKIYLKNGKVKEADFLNSMV
jgi:hypothetical protein